MHKPARHMFMYGGLLVLLAGWIALPAQDLPGSGPFNVRFTKGGISSLRYAMVASKRGSTLKVKPTDAVDFMEEEISGNILTRGWLETSFWQLGVEGGMRYTSQMGGWTITDYALHYSKDPARHLRLGYASLLSLWALMNSGPPASNYGFWYPGPENAGGAGSAYVAQPYGRTWAGKEQPRGPWSYSAEIDLGFGGALRAAEPDCCGRSGLHRVHRLAQGAASFLPQSEALDSVQLPAIAAFDAGRHQNRG